MLVLTVGNKDLRFEHSLASLSEWEGFYEKPFFSVTEDGKITPEEIEKYYEFMLHPSDFKHRRLLSELEGHHQLELVKYIQAKRTATIVRDLPDRPGPKENVTSELVYYWFVAHKIPFTPTDTWHFNRALMLVKIMGIKNAPATKKSKGQVIQDYRKINEERRKALGTSG